MELASSRGRGAESDMSKPEKAFFRHFLAYAREAFPEATLTADEQAAAFRRVLAEARQAVGRSPASAAGEVERLERALAYMREHFRTATLPDCAGAAGLSAFYFHRRFTAWAGRTPKAVLTDLQIEQAKALLLDGVELPEVAERCGFTHQSHLTSRFRLMVGTTPSRWRRARQVEALQAMAEPERQKAAA